MKKVLCSNCKNIATWIYMPGYGNGIEEDFHCDKCVYRGCSCNNEVLYYDKEDKKYNIEHIKHQVNEHNYHINLYNSEDIKKENFIQEITNPYCVKVIVNNIDVKELLKMVFVPVDENGKEYPCREYEYSENGFDKKSFDIVE